MKRYIKLRKKDWKKIKKAIFEAMEGLSVNVQPTVTAYEEPPTFFGAVDMERRLAYLEEKLKDQKSEKKIRFKELEREVDILRSTVYNLSQTVQRHERDIVKKD